jgi:exopolyphosphatase/guanosine-5'-triphosphate,3'-diphosphate pyrophosphatase
MKIAAIDIGSNALRLQIKDCSQPDFLLSLESLHEGEYYERVPLKSGMDVFAAGNILPPTKIRLTLALQHFAAVMRQFGVSRYRAVATSAYRDARNGQEVISRAGKDSGLNIEIIPGDEEARLTRLSFKPPQEWEDDYFLFVDVGGGSTEISVTRQGQLLYGHSFQVGSMRYLCNNQSPEQERMLDDKIKEIHHDCTPLHYIAAGGCVKFMDKYLEKEKRSKEKRSKEKGVRRGIIPVSDMEAVYADLQTKTVSQIVEHYDIAEERAVILTPACSIFLRIAAGIGAETITVPAIGVRNGILAELHRQTNGETDGN